MKAFIIYDDFEFAAKANSFLYGSSRKAEDTAVWNVKPWRADVLKLPIAGQEALLEAVDAHLIIFAGNRVKLFPSWLQRWMERWAAHRMIQHATLAVISDGRSQASSESDSPDLTEFARSHGLNLIFGDSGATALSTALSVQRFQERGPSAPPNP